VFAGFFIQARTIRDTQANSDAIVQQQQVIVALVEKDQAQTEQRQLALCRLLLTLNPDQESEISAAFSGMGVVCTSP
jgi:hypothetical protein